MSSDAFATLQHLRRYLETEVLDAIPASQRSELRAAIKTLADVERDLDVLPARLSGESARLLGLCGDALALMTTRQPAEAAIVALAERHRLLLRRSDESFQGLRQRHSLQADVQKLSSDIIAPLQAAGSDAPMRRLLRGFYTELQAQANARRDGQSVFAVSRHPSVLKE